MLRSKIIKQLNKKYPSLKLSQIEIIFDIIFSNITENLIKNRPVELRKLGRFSTKITKAKYNARNPKTNEIIYVPKKKKISFKMSKHLKEVVNSKWKKIYL